VRQFKKYRENNSVKAIVFVWNLRERVAAVRRFTKKQKKQRRRQAGRRFQWFLSLATGGYYSLAERAGFDHPGTLTGSIGVIMDSCIIMI